ncbi:hypothetical protein CEXT_303301 [Caerostris extrusa]|uniref:Uncharacterized protein n=1 Tax=Caerostris extrusa TaxID=172846 RepID=A0AAV4QP39_CAEEX|nr:hypothetical protein CEXT_303301 [Caerostris extrusa]
MHSPRQDDEWLCVLPGQSYRLVRDLFTERLFRKRIFVKVLLLRNDSGRQIYQRKKKTYIRQQRHQKVTDDDGVKDDKNISGDADDKNDGNDVETKIFGDWDDD